MKVTKLLWALMSLSVATACTVESNKDEKKPADLKVETRSLSGTVKNKQWQYGSAIIEVNYEGNYHVIIGRSGEVTCQNSFPMTPTINFTVPKRTGEYKWDANRPRSGAILVNAVFPYRTKNSGGADTVIAQRSIIRIDSIINGVVYGAVAAEAPPGSSYPGFRVSGHFVAEICD